MSAFVLLPEQAPHLIAATEAVDRAAGWVGLGLDVLGALMIVIGATKAVVRLTRRIRHGDDPGLMSGRLILARYLAWALEFQLAADILSTAIAPAWQRIGQLAAIAAIRTGLNYTLTREINAERDRTERCGRETEARKSNTEAARPA
jgi:uncharacterized membrane protein